MKLFLLVALAIAVRALGGASRPGVRLILLKSPVHWHVLNSALPTVFVLLERFSLKRSHIIVLYFIGSSVSN